ncbi:MAG TPA: hypothetical protein VGN96_01260 [Roseococcus sp.]|jgi:hypothetical protein|nr:hypothetical protein [Roseococcus sp.]
MRDQEAFSHISVLALLGASCIFLLLAVLWPRTGQPVLLTLPAAEAPSALGVAGWRVTGWRDLGPLRLLHLQPDHPQASPLALLRQTGGWLAINSTRSPGCP